MGLNERLQIIKNKLLKLKEKDQRLEIFGAGDDAYSGTQGHHYTLKQVVPEETLAWMEGLIGVKFPEEYREFLKQVCNGVAGPFWGLFPIEAALPPKDWFDKNPDFFKKPFPYNNADGERIIKIKEEQDQNFSDNSQGVPASYITLSLYGHDWNIIMPLNGEQYGKVWYFSHSNNAVSPIYKKVDNQYHVLTFLEWYEDWLERSLAPGAISDDPDRPFEDAQNVSSLSYQNRQITQFPDNALPCINVTKLNLDSNQLEILPPQIKVFSKLEDLSVCWNKLQSLPNEIGDLGNLKALVLKTNMIEKLPESIGNLKNLNYLYLGFNALHELPESIGNLENLENFYLEYNKLTKLPESIKNLKKLKYLNINGNQLPEEEKEKLRNALPNTEITF